MILGIVFSRNRAMQLDGALRSFFLHCRDSEESRLFVIYKATNSSYAQQYSHLQQTHRGVNFVEQTDFRPNVLELLATYGTRRPTGDFCRWLTRRGPKLGALANLCLGLDRPHYALLLVDDNIFVRDFHLCEVRDALDTHPEALGFSLRLGTNTTYCYALSKTQVLPTFTRLGNGMMEFNWLDARDHGCDFGYPLEVSSSVYRVNELLPLLNRLSFENPNTLEAQMAARSHVFQTNNSYLLCYEQSVTFCSPVNRVQEVFPNRTGTTPEYSTESLAKMFDADYRIKVEAYSGFVPNACHQEVQLLLEKETVSKMPV